MGLRDILAQLMAGGGGGQPSFDELLRRYQGDRDAAARQWNAQQGGPISSAYSPAAAAAPDPMTTGAIPMPAPRPDVISNAPIPAPRPEQPYIPSIITGGSPYPALPETAPIPQPAPTRLPPDLAVSPPHEPDRMAASAPTEIGAAAAARRFPKKKPKKPASQFAVNR